MYDDAYTRNEDGELAVRTVNVNEGSSSSSYDDVFTRDENGKLALRVTGGGGGGDQHNLGYYATQAALEEAYPTAEAGDWAIVGATDTVWIWDEDTSAWVDSDQKGQVTSVNNQTGAVVLGAQDVGAVPQYSSMPTASVDNLGDIIQFTGTTDANYTNGYFYKCVSDGQDPATYSWTAVQVQASSGGLPDQTGQSGKFLTTNGTDASWGTELTDALVIRRSGATDNCLILHNGTSYGSIYMQNSSSSFYFSRGLKVGGNVLPAFSGYELGSSNLKWILYATKINNGADITVPTTTGTMVVADYTSAQQGDVLTLDSSGNAVWQAGGGGGGTSSISVTLPAADWVNDEQTVTATGVTASNTVIVGATPASASEYNTSGVICTAQGADSLTFSCSTTPSNDLTVTVLIF